MNLSEYTYLLNNPNAVNEKQAKALETVVDSFPYFQSARALYLKGLYNQDSYKYNFALKQTAAHTTDRSVLFDFITSDEFTIIEKDIYEQKLALLMDIEVVESDTHQFIENNEFKKETIEVDKIPVLPTFEFESSDIDFVKVEEVLTVSQEIEAPAVIETPSGEEEQILVDLEEKEEVTATIEKSIIEIDETEEEPVFSLISEEAEEETVSFEEEVEESLNESISNDNTPQLEEKLEIGKPIAFSQNEKHSFQEWLQLASFNPIERKKESIPTISSEITTEKTPQKVRNVAEKQKKLEIIDKFIETNPKITPAREVVEAPAKQAEISDTSHLMTETLARVYLEQKKYGKAIQAYEILILKYPEKSIFFADRIKDIKILQQNNQ